MDAGAWFEVTPESVARHIADRLSFDRVVDGTCGVGGNAIQFALTSRSVVAVDTDPGRLSDARHNAGIYGVADRIDFVHDDFAHFAEVYSGPPIDAVFLSPPWGGPGHLESNYFSLRDVQVPDIVHLFAAAAKLSPRVALYLP
ncbi:Tgs1, partial [Symbiodinium necroappetens]